MSPRKRKKRRSGFGRMLELMADGILILVVLAFGISIAARYAPESATMRRTSDTSSGSEDRSSRGSIVSPEEPSSAEDAAPAPDQNRPTVDIRNGCGQAGLAEEMMHRLRRAGFDVVEYTDADRYDYGHTLVKDRAGKPAAAGQVCAWLQRELGVGETVHDPVPTPSSDVLLILGADLADTLNARAQRAQAHR